MKQVKAAFIMVTTLFFITVPAFAQEPTCTRHLEDVYQSPGTMTVTLTLLLPEEKPNALIVKEIIPAGWSVGEATPWFERFDPLTGEVKWLLMGNLSSETQIIYEVVIPAGVVGEKNLSGKVLYTDVEGGHREVEIGGDKKARALAD